MICLGIESTADNLGVGVASSDGAILANEVSTYTPEKGGIHPREAARHHAMEIGEVIARALERAGLEAGDIDVVAFSRGPGLGPCLRTGATAARALASYLGVPLVGVNHCVAHIEIGRLSSGAEDPLTLYVSGGNTIVAGFEAGRYRVYGETLDIAVGNCLDVFAREAGLPYPGGPAVERMALKGERLIPLPYVVKGMDLSFTGLLTAALQELKRGCWRLEDLCYSLQEVAYAMLGEVTERALAHTRKPELLLTGGVAANRRLRSIIQSIAEEHGATPHYVPTGYATDNGAMIAWTGILAYTHGMTTPLERSHIDSDWRIDEVEVPWRKEGSKSELKIGRGEDAEPSGSKMVLISKGAEADLWLDEDWNGRRVIIKRRGKKSYRHPDLDEELRRYRTVHEAEIIHRAKRAGVSTPIIYQVDPEGKAIVMQYVEGVRVREALESLDHGDRVRLFRLIGVKAGRLHGAGIIHGDLTTSNIIWNGESPFFIDFGLAELSREAEKRGVDLHLMRRMLMSTHFPHVKELSTAFEEGYRSIMGAEAEEAIRKVREIERRGRYVKRENESDMDADG
ncbi:bifunctional N(6)-L-threonylcarbamoyladenine synthase/serine/threonine protein kinase [Candidatus Bathyarchaeota archaeon]|nr:bifunctional N(6)-L-threonylcarbamoyladenine synthase/serine/threonine protein kinase [Candidatus Bathyarchaeota archaeon]